MRGKRSADDALKWELPKNLETTDADDSTRIIGDKNTATLSTRGRGTDLEIGHRNDGDHTRRRYKDSPCSCCAGGNGSNSPG